MIWQTTALEMALGGWVLVMLAADLLLGELRKPQIWVVAVLAVLGVVITAVYMLRMIRGVFFGAIGPAVHHVSDARSLAQRLPYYVLASTLLVVGCWPGPLSRLIDSSAQPFISRALQSQPTAPAAIARAMPEPR